MGKLWGGGALLATSILMVVGFLGANVDPSAPATVVALLISAGLPAVGGGWLLAKHFGLGRQIEARKEQLRLDTIEAEVLRMAGRFKGRLTAVEVAGELAVPTGTAETVLNELMACELADIEITESGLIVYAFHDVKHLAEKADAKGLLEP